MASYARRIDRPRGWYLEPFITVQDAFNFSVGNPDLLPEDIDSYELNYQKRFTKDFISLEGYYRVTHNKIERYPPMEVTLSRPVRLVRAALT